MPLGQAPPRVVARDGADRHRTARRADRVPDPACVRGAAHAVGDHRGDAQGRIEALEAQHGRRRAARLRARVHDQHHGGAEPLRDLRRRARVARTVEPVEAAHDALDDRDVDVGRVPGDRREHGVAAAHPPVEVVRRAPRRHRVQAGIDEIGTDLEWLHGESAAAQRAEQAERDRRLSDAARDTRDDEDAAHAGPSTPADLKVAISV